MNFEDTATEGVSVIEIRHTGKFNLFLIRPPYLGLKGAKLFSILWTEGSLFIDVVLSCMLIWTEGISYLD